MDNKINYIIDIFTEKYPVPDTALNYSSPFELLVATILSAQTTDVQVNKVTARLFKKYSTPRDFAELKPEELAREIKSLGLYRNKSKYIVRASQMLLKKFEGQVPRNRQDLERLPGVGRKTASVVLAVAFARDTFPVDTHVFRVANRLGLADSDRVEGVESQIKEQIPREYWTKLHHWLIYHGREICQARNPDCANCELKQVCDYYRQSSR